VVANRRWWKNHRWLFSPLPIPIPIPIPSPSLLLFGCRPFFGVAVVVIAAVIAAVILLGVVLLRYNTIMSCGGKRLLKIETEQEQEPEQKGQDSDPHVGRVVLPFCGWRKRMERFVVCEFLLACLLDFKLQQRSKLKIKNQKPKQNSHHQNPYPYPYPYP
jgi:hypothetical protein